MTGAGGVGAGVWGVEAAGLVEGAIAGVTDDFEAGVVEEEPPWRL